VPYNDVELFEYVGVFRCKRDSRLAQPSIAFIEYPYYGL